MKKLLLFIFVLMTVGCSKVPSGYVGVKVYLLGTDKGVDVEELGVGRYWIGFNEELHLFPTFTQNYVWTKDVAEGSRNDESITFQTKKGLTVSADIGISYHIKKDLVTNIFQKYRRGVNEITDVYLRNIVRDSLVKISGSMEVESIYGEGKAKLIDDVQNMVIRQVAPLGIVIEKIYLVGSIRLPKTVISSINAKIQATQKAQQRQNEVAEAKAEADKTIAKSNGKAESILKVAIAQSKANKLINNSITQQLVNYKSIEKWDGKLPTYSGGEAVPFISLQ